MPLAHLASNIRLITAAVLFGTLTIAGWGQEPPAAPVPQNTPETRPLPVLNYSQPVSHFPNPIGPYTARHLAAPNLANTARIDQLMRDGKLYLSLNDAIALALENNLDIAIARYNLNIADTDVLRAKAGAPTLGVNTGIVQNTPGSGVGGLGGQVGSGTGGTTLGAGGAGAGAGGLVGSTLGLGSLITSFDPVVTGTLQEDRFHILPSSTFNPESAQNTTTGNVSYQQGFSWGTNLLVGFNNTRITTGDAPFTTLSPQLNSSFKFQLTQHLLQGFGFAANNRFISIAKNDRELSDVAFRLQVITTVNQIQSMYWDLTYAYENARVQKESLAFAEKTLSDTKKQVEIGSLAPIETVRAQSTVAQDQQAVTIALTNLQLEQLLMKNALSRTLRDQVLAGAEVIPTSTMKLPESEPIQPTQDLIADALRHRADLVESRIQLNTTDISNKAVRNALLPTLDLFAYYGGTGWVVYKIRRIFVRTNRQPSRPRAFALDQIPLSEARPSSLVLPPQATTAPSTNSSTPLLPTRALVCSSIFRCVTAPRRRCRSAPNWNTSRPRCVCSKSKTRSASKSATPSSESNRTAPV
jgi:outer membrane protein